MSTPQKPGEKPQKPGPYTETGPRGGKLPNPAHTTITTDDGHLPPTPKPNHTWTPGKKK